jgi:hypothetical protein
MQKVDKIAGILNEVNNSAVISDDDRDTLYRAPSGDIAMAQSRLLDGGFEPRQLWQMWDSNKRLLPDQAEKLRAELPLEHVLRRVVSEHDMLLCFVAELEEITGQILTMDSASSSSLEIRKLEHITQHCLASEQHAEREEQVIYPELIKKGFAPVLKTVTVQHFEIRRAHRKLNELVWQIDTLKFEAFKNQLSQVVAFIVPTLKMHIFFEDNIILPLLLEVVRDNKVWDRVKYVCDQIGYCGFHN